MGKSGICDNLPPKCEFVTKSRANYWARRSVPVAVLFSYWGYSGNSFRHLHTHGREPSFRFLTHISKKYDMTELKTLWTLNRGNYCHVFFNDFLKLEKWIDPLLVNKSHIYRKHFLYWTDSLWCQQRLFVYFFRDMICSNGIQGFRERVCVFENIQTFSECSPSPPSVW